MVQLVHALLGCEGPILLHTDNIDWPSSRSDLNSGCNDQKSSMEECQNFCKADIRCVSWVYETQERPKPGCCHKKNKWGRTFVEMKGGVSGKRNACLKGT